VTCAEAIACFRRGDLAGAEAAVTRALSINPRDAEALNVRAMLRHQRGDVIGAIEAIGEVIALTPGDAAAHFNRAAMLHQAGRLEEAVHGYARALALEPRDLTAWIQRAAAERALGRLEDVVSTCAQALEIDARNPAALNEGAAALGKLGRFEEALALFDRLVRAAPESASAHTNRGKTLAGLGRFEDACAAYKAALRANPKHAPAWNNLGVARMALGRYAEAVEAYESACLGENQNFETGHPLYNLAVALLMLGEYERGFALYRHRFAAGASRRPPRVEQAALWTGERLDGLLRIRSEQGVGDQLLFTRLLPLVMERTPRVAVDCDPRIASLLSRAYPQLEAVLAPNETCRHAQAHIAMGDIAGALHVAQSDISAIPVALRADEAKTAALRARYSELASGRPVVGIAWAAPHAAAAHAKTAGLEHWGALLREPCFFVSLQYGDDREEVESARVAFGCCIHRDESVDQMRSMEDFAAQLAALDHIVTISNTTAHVAGALGLRALVLAPPGHGLHWYWGYEGESTPWYPSLGLVRRALGAPWSEQVAIVARAVRNALLP